MELWFSEQHTNGVKFSIKVDRQLYSGQSEFQRIDIFDSKEFGRFLALDGYMMLTEKDEFIYLINNRNEETDEYLFNLARKRREELILVFCRAGGIFSPAGLTGPGRTGCYKASRKTRPF